MPNKIQWGNFEQKARKKNAEHSFYMFRGFPTGASNGCPPTGAKISRAFCLGFRGVSLGFLGSERVQWEILFSMEVLPFTRGVEIKLNGRVLSGPPDLFCTPRRLDRTSDQPRS